MEQKRVSYKVAKAIKEAGYPQGDTDEVYVLETLCMGSSVSPKGVTLPSHFAMMVSGSFADIPTYLDVWLWLWREKKFSIDVDCYNCDKWTTDINSVEFNDPEEAIIAAIEYLVDNNLIK